MLALREATHSENERNEEEEENKRTEEENETTERNFFRNRVVRSWYRIVTSYTMVLSIAIVSTTVAVAALIALEIIIHRTNECQDPLVTTTESGTSVIINDKIAQLLTGYNFPLQVGFRE